MLALHLRCSRCLASSMRSKILSGRKLTTSPTCLLYAIWCTRRLTVLPSGLRRSPDRLSPNLCSRMTRRSNPRKIPIMWQWPNHIATRCSYIVLVLPVVSLSKSTQIVRRFVKRMTLRYQSCLVGIWLASVPLVRGLPICLVLHNRICSRDKDQQLWHIIGSTLTSLLNAPAILVSALS